MTRFAVAMVHIAGHAIRSPAPARAFRALLATSVALAVVAMAQLATADEIDRYLERQRTVYQVPAFVVGVIRAGKLVDSRAIGVTNVELDVPASTRHVFEIGSISKQFTAYAILILYENGKVELNAPVGRYLPELPAAWAAPTLHQLMSHISGLPDFEEAFGYGVYRETPSDDEFLKRLLTLPIGGEPGRKWSYSNTNYWLLARVIERIGGMSYAQFMQERVFAPLGMTSTRTALPDRILDGRASGYRLVNDRLENRDPIQPNTGRGLGDIVTTVGDMARWEQEQRKPTIVKADTARRAREAVKLLDGSATNYGYGWFTDDGSLPAPKLEHGGQTAGFVADYLRVPDRDLAIVVFANRYDAPSDSVARHIARAVEPALRGPALVKASSADPRRTDRVSRLVASGATARSDWREEWFTADTWRSIQPYLADIESTYRRRGAVQSVTPVGVDAVQDKAKPKYRVAFENTARLMTLEFDDAGRIKSASGEDE